MKERIPTHWCILDIHMLSFRVGYGVDVRTSDEVGQLDTVRVRSGFRCRHRQTKSLYAKRTGRGGRGLEVCRLRPVGHAFGLRAAAAWPRVSVSGRSSAGPADVAVTGYGKICVS